MYFLSFIQLKGDSIVPEYKISGQGFTICTITLKTLAVFSFVREIKGL